MMTDQWHPATGIARALSTMPELWARLLADHVPDSGGRCQACTKAGTGLPGQRWPCTIYALADQARDLHPDETVA
ncbi:MAG TPA: hypothetical protein VD813_13805 [Pseudonocardia sp.]|nr:hypothetical protein [Pseudonocardia sp.]